MIEDISKIGNKLVLYGYNSSNSGNISARTSDDSILITRTGVFLDELDKDSFVEIKVKSKDDKDKEASCEYQMHRKIYQDLDYNAVIHSHCTMAVVFSLKNDVDFFEPVLLPALLLVTDDLCLPCPPEFCFIVLLELPCCLTVLFMSDLL